MAERELTTPEAPITTTRQMRVEDFEVLATHPEAPMMEWIGGEVYEVPSNPFVSMIAIKIAFAIMRYLEANPIAFVTGEHGGYVVNGHRYAPDVAVILKARQPELARKGYNPNPPDLAVEVISDPENAEESRVLRLKLSNYAAAGTIVWVIEPQGQHAEVYAPGQAGVLLTTDHALTAEAVLPGFSLPLRELFGKN